MTDDVKVVIGGDARPVRSASAEATRAVRDFERSSQQQLARAQMHFQSFARVARNVLGAAGIGFGLTATVRGIRSIVTETAQLGDLADRLQVSASALQQWRFAADQSGSSANTMDDALAQLTTRLGEFRSTGTGPAAEALRQLGLAQRVLSGEIANSEDAFRAIIAQLGNVTSAHDRAALAARLFGRTAGPELSTLLSRGAEGLRELEELAPVLGDEMVKQAQRVNDEWGKLIDRISVGIRGAVLQALSHLELFRESGLEAEQERLLDLEHRLADARERGAGDTYVRRLADAVEHQRSIVEFAEREAQAAAERLQRARDMATADRERVALAEREAELKDAIADAERQLQAADRQRIELQARRREEALTTIRQIEERWLEAFDMELELIRRRAEEQLAALDGMEASEREQAAARVKIIETANRQMLEVEMKRVREIGQAQGQMVREMEAVFERGFDRIGSSITDAMTTGRSEMISLRNVGLGVVSELHQAFLRLALFNPLRNLVTGSDLPTLASIFGGGSAPAVAGPVSRITTAGALIDLFHGGGTVGQPAGARRMVPFSAFESAPRMHNGGWIADRLGLRHDERPIIAQTGERILARGESAGGVSIVQNFSFAAGASMPDRAAMRRFAQEVRDSTVAAVREGRMRDPGFFGGT